MIDLAAPLQAAIKAAILADAGVAAAVTGGKVRVFDVPPHNVAGDYIIIGGDDIDPIRAEGFALVETDATVNIWSLTEPPGLAVAKVIGGALVACLLAMTSVAGLRIYATDFQRSRYLIDPADQLTAHGIVVIRFTLAPA
jgi:hypothetical protein